MIVGAEVASEESASVELPESTASASSAAGASVTSVETEVLSPVSSANASAVVDIIENSMLAANATEVTFCIIFCIMRFPFCTAAFLQALWLSAKLQRPCTHCFLLPYIFYHMRFASLGNKAETQILQKAKSNFSTTQIEKEAEPLWNGFFITYLGLCNYDNMVRKACEDYQSNIWYIICKKSLKVSGISVAVSSFSGRQNVEYHFPVFCFPRVNNPHLKEEA